MLEIKKKTKTTFNISVLKVVFKFQFFSSKSSQERKFVCKTSTFGKIYKTIQKT